MLAGHNRSGVNIIVEDIMMNDDRNGSVYICILPQISPPDIESDPTTLYVAGEYEKVCDIVIIHGYYIHMYAYIYTLHVSNKN